MAALGADSAAELSHNRGNCGCNRDARRHNPRHIAAPRENAPAQVTTNASAVSSLLQPPATKTAPGPHRRPDAQICHLTPR